MFKLLALVIIGLLANVSAIAAEFYKCETISRAFFLHDDMFESIEKPDFIFSLHADDIWLKRVTQSLPSQKP